MQSLDDLRRILRRIETRRPPRAAAEPLERVVGGELVETGAGSLLVVRREYPLEHRHGRVPLDGVRRAPLDVLARVARVESEALAAERLLFLDTETTGLAGGTGTYAFLVGAGWIEGDVFVVAQHFMRDLDEEPALLAALAPLLERAGGVVTFNGAGFDLPLLETRFVLARRRWPATLPHLDLLRPSRRVWTGCFDDCRLGTLERDVLGLAREEDVPGALIPSLYFDWVRLRLAWWEKRAARWETACALWDVARQRELFDPRPWEELAKFQEHRARDFAAARVVVTDALDLARAAGAADGVLAAFGHRLGRIERRLGLHDPAGAS